MCYGCYDLAGDIVASQRTAMPAPTPDGMTYHHHTTYDNIPINDPNGSTTDWINPPPDHPYRAKGHQPDQSDGAMPMFMPPAVEARHNGQYVGHLEWTPEGKKVQIIHTVPDHRRQGIATAMWDHARSVEPEVQHSNNRTDLGRQWVDHEQSRMAAWDGTTAEPSPGWKPATTPFIARGMNISHPEDDHDMFHAINEGRATPDHMRRLVTNGGTGNAGIWWGTYSHPDSPDPHAYGSFGDFADHAGEGANPSESVANYHDSGEYHERTQDRKELGKADSIFAEVPVVMVGKRPKRGDAQWDPELHNPSNGLMGNSYLDDDEPVDLHEVHYHNGRDWHTVPMGGHQVTARWQDYHQERERQERALDEATGGYDADKADYFARGGQPLITFKDWIKGNGGLQNHNDQAKADFDPNYVHTPDPSWGEAPAWTASLRAASVPGYDFHLVNTSGYGDGTVAAYPQGTKPGPNNWHSAIQWDKDGQIAHVDTKPQHQGKGLARGLYEHVKGTYRPDLMHGVLTDDGKGFANAMGGQMRDETELQRRRDQRVVDNKLPYDQRADLHKNRGWPESWDAVQF